MIENIFILATLNNRATKTAAVTHHVMARLQELSSATMIATMNATTDRRLRALVTTTAAVEVPQPLLLEETSSLVRVLAPAVDVSLAQLRLQRVVLRTLPNASKASASKAFKPKANSLARVFYSHPAMNFELMEHDRY